MPATSATRQTLPPPWVISALSWPQSIPPPRNYPYRRWGPRIGARCCRRPPPVHVSIHTHQRGRGPPPLPACLPSRVDEILASYDHTIEASTRATSKLDNLALALDASTWPLAALHAEPQWVLRAFGPRETSAPDGSAIRQSATGASLPGSESECRQSPRPAHWCPCQTAATASPRANELADLLLARAKDQPGSPRCLRRITTAISTTAAAAKNAKSPAITGS
jgi:hypothetical protein